MTCQDELILYLASTCGGLVWHWKHRAVRSQLGTLRTPLHVLLHLQHANGPQVNLVRPVSDAQCPHASVHAGQVRVLAHAHRTVKLNGGVDDPAHHLRYKHLRHTYTQARSRTIDGFINKRGAQTKKTTSSQEGPQW